MRALLLTLALLVLAIVPARAQVVSGPQSCPDSTFPSGFDATGTIQCRSVQWPADVTFPAIFGSGVLAETCVDLTSATEIQLVLDQPGQIVVGSHIEVRSVDDPLTFAYGTVSQYDNSTGTPVLKFVISQLQGGGVYCAYNVQIITKPQTAAGTGTRISLYQMNGLQITQDATTSSKININAGSIRDSSDTVDLVYSGGNIDLSLTTSLVTVAGAGTITSGGAGGTTVTGSGTSFLSFFGSGDIGLTDFNNQLAAIGQSAQQNQYVPNIATSTQTAFASVSTNTTLTSSSGLGASGASYTRNGPVNTNNTGLLSYAIVLAYKTADGSTAAFASSVTPSGTPDLPAGYSYYRVIGMILIRYDGVSKYVVVPAQPLIAFPYTSNGDMAYFSVNGINSTFVTRLPIGSNGNVLGVSSGLPAWLPFAAACTAATSSTFGCVKVDNSTITAAAGVITAANTTVAGATCTPGSSCGLSKAQNTLSGDVTMTPINTFVDGPSMAQGTSGTWFASGTVTVSGTAGDAIVCKLWDGTTVIATTENSSILSAANPISLSGYITSPAANIRISCEDTTHNTGKIKASVTGLGADSTIWGIRIN